MRSSGLTVSDAGYLEGAFEFPDQATMLRGQRSGQKPCSPSEPPERKRSPKRSSTPSRLRTASGGYRIELEWRYVTAAA